MSVITYDSERFYKNGKPHVIRSGAMHYFRIPREYWHDRLEKLYQCGFNTVETYVCWNAHEKKEGVFDFSGMLDLGAYIDEAKKTGLDVIIRPGPYICAEWEFGGLPSWLNSVPGLKLRCDNPQYLGKVRTFFEKLFEILSPRMAERGGNIIMLQVENEYGSYGNDKEYTGKLRDMVIELGATCLLTTSDGPSAWHLAGGSVEGTLTTVNFGSNPEGNFAILKEFRNDVPLMCSEFWCGWFDHWGDKHHSRDAGDVADCYDRILSMGGSVNFYMFHGGTNFGFFNGANDEGADYQPTLTSYDYFAPLTESGDLTECYYRLREVNEKHFGPLQPLTVTDTPKKAYGSFKPAKAGTLFGSVDKLCDPICSKVPPSVDEIGQDFGYTLYRTEITGPCEGQTLFLDGMRDRALVYLNGRFAGLIECGYKADEVKITLGHGEKMKIDVLVENMGRVNYGPKLGDSKGIGVPRISLQHLFGWKTYPLTEELLCMLDTDCGGFPALYRGTLEITGKVCDTFIYPEGFRHGFIRINGFNIGRYYTDRGPQKTLYVPAPILKSGENVIEVFETDGIGIGIITFTDKHDLG